MLTLQVPVEEGFDNTTGKFVQLKTFELELEHSLASLSKWEEKHEKPFLSEDDKTPEETISYIQIMTLTNNVPHEVWLKLSKENLEAINAYINKKMTATWFNEPKHVGPPREIITAELIYYWMIALQIPWEAQYWHLNKLLTLVKVCNHKSQPPKKMGKRELAQRHRDINAQRRAQQGTSG